MEIGSVANRPIAEAFVRAPSLRKALSSAVADLERLASLLPNESINLDSYRELLKETPEVY